MPVSGNARVGTGTPARPVERSSTCITQLTHRFSRPKKPPPVDPRTLRVRDDPSRKAAKECSPRRKPWVSATDRQQAPRGRKKLPENCHPPRPAGIKLINFPTSQTSCCTNPHTSAINNPPRAEVWLAGRIICISRARPASKFQESNKLSIVPATGLHSERKHFRRVPSKQGPPTRIFSQFLVFRIGLPKKRAESGV
jgi:hypothetical protein